MQKQLLTENDIKSAESVLAKGDRVELIPVKDGVKVIRIRREEIKEKNEKACDCYNNNCYPAERDLPTGIEHGFYNLRTGQKHTGKIFVTEDVGAHDVYGNPLEWI